MPIGYSLFDLQQEAFMLERMKFLVEKLTEINLSRQLRIKEADIETSEPNEG